MELDFLANMSGDWAFWDRSYEFVVDADGRIRSGESPSDTWTSLGVNMILFLGTDGRIVRADYVDLATGEAGELPRDLADRSLEVRSSEALPGTRREP